MVVNNAVLSPSNLNNLLNNHMVTNDPYYKWALYVYFAFPIVILPILSFINAPYGRFSRKFLIDVHINGKLGWVTMETVSPVTLVFSAFVVPMGIEASPWSSTKTILVSMWLIHYLHRAFIYTIRVPSIAPMHIFTCLFAILYNIINGYTNGRWIGVYNSYPDENLTDSWFLFGVTLWAVGLCLNIYHDNILFSLRKKKQRKDGFNENNQQHYVIPRGALFEYISCPSYFTETVEWFGFAIAAWYSIPAILFVITTIANLFPRAWKTHGWYQKKFEDYPKNRKAVVPFVF